ncbi:unannotated protein [freshwater metagenome]|uniref:Unannotated protein n=1 Tax=freshwater metagenome TaxID=449393 RepID=A0A6J7QZI8_9ZZZZ
MEPTDPNMPSPTGTSATNTTGVNGTAISPNPAAITRPMRRMNWKGGGPMRDARYSETPSAPKPRDAVITANSAEPPCRSRLASTGKTTSSR